MLQMSRQLFFLRCELFRNSPRLYLNACYSRRVKAQGVGSCPGQTLRRDNVITLTLPMTDTEKIARPAAPKPNSLIALVEALQARQEGALEAVISKTEKPCFHLALSILKDPELAKDALQESYFVVYRRISQLNEPAAFKSWLFRIVKRSCHDIIRKRDRELETDLQQRDDLVAESDSAPTDPGKLVTRQEHLRSIFRKLPDIDREAIALREIASLSYEEMGRVLSIPIGTVRLRLAKARKRFIQAYQKEQNS